MTESEKKAVLTVSLMAAFADGAKHDREREEVRRIAEGLATEGLHLPSLYQDVLMKRVSLPAVLAELKSEEAQHLAYEMAVTVCDADGALSDAERRFLGDLRAAWKMPADAGREFERMAEQVATAPIAVAPAPSANSSGMTRKSRRGSSASCCTPSWCTTSPCRWTRSIAMREPPTRVVPTARPWSTCSTGRATRRSGAAASR